MSSYIPMNYESLNIYQGNYNPSTVYATDNAEVWFWERSLYQRAMAALDIEIPSTWNMDYFKYVLAYTGRICVLNTAEYGVIPQFCDIHGYGIYFEPKYCNVVTPYIDKKDLLIGRDCALIKFTPDYFGIYDTIHHYAEKLALISSSIDMNAFNSRLAYIISAKNKAGAEAIKKALDKISRGEPNVVIGSELFKGVTENETPWVEYSRDVKNSYIGESLWNEHRTILNEFDTEVGIPNSGQDKKERRNTEEITVQYNDSKCRLLTWIESMKPGFKTVKELYGIECSAKPHFESAVNDNG